MILASLLSPFAVAATLINQGVKPEVFHALEEKDTINYRYLMRTHIGLTLLLGFFFICFSYFLIFYLNFDQGQYNLGPSIIVISSLIVTALSMYYPYSNTLLFYEKTTELSMGTYIMTSCLIFIYLASKYYNFEIFNVLVMVLLSAFLYVIYYQIAEIRVLKKINVNR
jgi:hypothetical protein